MTYDKLHQKLETKEGKKEVFKLARARKRRRCIKHKDGKVLAKEVQIKEIWQRYFSKLLNKEVLKDFRSTK